MYVHVYIYIYIYTRICIYIYRERETCGSTYVKYYDVTIVVYTCV